MFLNSGEEGQHEFFHCFSLESRNQVPPWGDGPVAFGYLALD
ncbi:hypothetical protein TorRG33x02_078000 [Trema orientale]|uniref:Uncharacterized protein n=1 Tax=Trema orientale TaxID=63057 RepID=A0A2P5FFG1_TREOI|nr:hypothetical protein TorRG33x02_078000 [Trema orientale]